MLKAYEGYLEEDRFYPIGAPMNIQGRRKVIVTVLNEPTGKKSDTWAELKKLVSEMSEDEKPRLEDFPRTKFGRKLIDFDEV